MTLLERIKVLFNEVPAPAESSFVDVKSGDLLLRISSIEQDGTVEVIGEDGTLVAADDNTYQLEDGSSIVVVGGKISEVISADSEPAVDMADDKTPAAVAEDAAPGDVAEVNPKAVDAIVQVIADETGVDVTEALVAKIEEIVAVIEEMKKEMASLMEKKSKFEVENAKLEKENDELAKKASAPAVSIKKFEKSQSVNITESTNRFLNRVLDSKK